MNSRLKSIQEYLQKHDIDAFLVLTKINRQYLSGFTGSAGVLVITPRRAELYVDERYTIRARRESKLPVKNIKKLTMTPSISPPHEGEVRRGSRRIKVGVEDRISLKEFESLKKSHKVQWKITHNVIENLRAVKSPEEIKYIKKGSEIIDGIFRRIVRKLKKNNAPQPPLKVRGGEGELSESDMALEIERLAKKLGAEALAFDPIVASGPNAAAPHHFSSNQRIKKSNFLLLDYGVVVRGYHSDFTRTLFIGKPDKRQEKVYNTVLGAQIRAIGEIRKNLKASHIDSVARRFIGSKGFGRKFTHNTGHGVGLEIHELPNFSPDSEDILLENMIVTVEPGIYIEGWGGVRIEDMVLVGKRPAVLSKVGKEFKDMIISF